MATNASFVWEIAPSGQLIPGVDRYGRDIVSGIAQIAQMFAARIEGWMKANAPWSDRTGAARQGLRGFAETSAAGAVIWAVHSVFYGIFLELGTSKMAPRPVVWPAIAAHGAAIMAAVRALVGA